jgi:hypothetical protein
MPVGLIRRSVGGKWPLIVNVWSPATRPQTDQFVTNEIRLQGREVHKHDGLLFPIRQRISQDVMNIAIGPHVERVHDICFRNQAPIAQRNSIVQVLDRLFSFIDGDYRKGNPQAQCAMTNKIRARRPIDGG